MVLQDFSTDMGAVANGSLATLRGVSERKGAKSSFEPLEGEPPAGAEDGRFTGESKPEKSHCQSSDARGGELLPVFGLTLEESCSRVDLRPDLALMVDCGLDELPPPIMDVILLETEWLGRTVDILLDVSEEIVDNGRGMNSKTSENPTREERGGPAWGGCSSCAAVPSDPRVMVVASG